MAGFFVVFSKSVLFMPHFDSFFRFCFDLEMLKKKGQTTDIYL